MTVYATVFPFAMTSSNWKRRCRTSLNMRLIKCNKINDSRRSNGKISCNFCSIACIVDDVLEVNRRRLIKNDAPVVDASFVVVFYTIYLMHMWKLKMTCVINPRAEFMDCETMCGSCKSETFFCVVYQFSFTSVYSMRSFSARICKRLLCKLSPAR